MGENDLVHFRKQTPKREKAYPKMGENSVKNFQNQGIPPSPGRAANAHSPIHIFIYLNIYLICIKALEKKFEFVNDMNVKDLNIV